MPWSHAKALVVLNKYQETRLDQMASHSQDILISLTLLRVHLTTQGGLAILDLYSLVSIRQSQFSPNSQFTVQVPALVLADTAEYRQITPYLNRRPADCSYRRIQ